MVLALSGHCSRSLYLHCEWDSVLFCIQRVACMRSGSRLSSSWASWLQRVKPFIPLSLFCSHGCFQHPTRTKYSCCSQDKRMRMLAGAGMLHVPQSSVLSALTLIYQLAILYTDGSVQVPQLYFKENIRISLSGNEGETSVYLTLFPWQPFWPHTVTFRWIININPDNLLKSIMKFSYTDVK